MNRQRKETIIQEIEYWKKSRLLPEQYCNYLMALYTEGEEPIRLVKRKIFKQVYAILLCLLVPITFLVIYFTEMQVDLQMLLVTFFVFLSIIGFFVFREEQLLQHITVTIKAILILILTIKVLDIMEIQMPGTFIFITIQALIWFLIGYLKKWYYLNIAAILTMVLLVVKVIVM
ncbi:hypothetical protein [Sutcliffiella rhizosphaerae]|uniref:Uncharacterized protein n=1 Tax=Sutcliffiella rhizosphaerae TaxID=2880967 RepID=A0ABM8YHK1_9BACI|nr:hypothetical protein [Sutcliffiella rhizosphaerae]CAG9619341.1 hypothetical protein BACCIP111883_00108 [Sutcliffiella rhizosphaerae]